MVVGQNKSTSPKKEGEGKKSEIRKIINLSYPDGTPYGWAFHGFYDAKEELKSLSNRDGMITFIGGDPYRPFSNLTTKWLKSEFSGYIWVIRIDIDLIGTEHCFPMTAHKVYGNKIARGLIKQNIWERGEVDIGKATLTEPEARDLDERFSAVPYVEAKDSIFHEAIKAADSALKNLI
jgi:hypothetical protein